MTDHCDSLALLLHCYLAVSFLYCLSCFHASFCACWHASETNNISRIWLTFLPKQPSTQTTSKNSVHKQAFPQSFKQAVRIFPQKASWGWHERDDKRVNVKVEMSGFRGMQNTIWSRRSRNKLNFLHLTSLGFVTLNANIPPNIPHDKIGHRHQKDWKRTCYGFNNVSFKYSWLGLSQGSNAFLDLGH